MMNKQIKKLATKANLQIDKFKCVTGINSIDLLDVELEKFAELIVEECAEVAASNGDSDLIGIIKAHFGLE